MKGLYIYFDFTTRNNESVGVIKKIQTQRMLFDSVIDQGCDCINLSLKTSKNKAFRFFSYMFSNKSFDLSFLVNNKYDFVYVRRINPNCKSVIHLLKILKIKNPNCKILYELPTFPYDFEHNTFSLKLLLLIDRIYRKRLYKYVDRIVTLTDDTVIFNCKTLKIKNGVDCVSIPVCKKETYNSNTINLIAVAQFSFWHGYERIIEGLHNYGKKNVKLHLVGNGSDLEKYKELVRSYNLENQVLFYGALSGAELTAVFDIADIAICSLACHKKNIYLSSELKSREYLCRGLPIITSTKIDVIPDDFKYVLRVPEDDTPIDISKIIEFSQRIYESSSVGNFESKEYKVKSEIRKFAEQNCDMKIAMKSVVEYFYEETV